MCDLIVPKLALRDGTLKLLRQGEFFPRRIAQNSFQSEKLLFDKASTNRTLMLELTSCDVMLQVFDDVTLFFDDETNNVTN